MPEQPSFGVSFQWCEGSGITFEPHGVYGSEALGCQDCRWTGRVDMTDIFGPLTTWTQPGHDQPSPGVWICGECPYLNRGSICSKCGAPAGGGRFLGEPVTHEYLLDATDAR